MAAKRTKLIIAADDRLSVKVALEVKVQPGVLTRDEHEHLTEVIASEIMKLLPTFRHVYVPLSKVKIR